MVKLAPVVFMTYVTYLLYVFFLNKSTVFFIFSLMDYIQTVVYNNTLKALFAYF